MKLKVRVVEDLVNHRGILVVGLSLLSLAALVAIGSARGQDRNVNQVQARIRERMIREQGGNYPSVRFYDNGNFESISNTETRVRGNGIYYRDRDDRGRQFSYDAVFDFRYGDLRRLNYSFNGSNNGGGNNGGGNNGGGGADSGYGQTIYCASDDGRRNQCSADTRGGVTLVNQRSEAACIQGRSWGFRRNYIWVDRGCRADFQVGGGNSYPEDHYSPGSVTWSGRVDHDIKLIIYTDRLEFFLQSGKDLGQGNYQFTSRRPRNAQVSVRRIKGRNDIEITE